MSSSQTLSEARIAGGQVFARLMHFTACVGATVHAAFLIVFGWVGWQALALLNLASMLVYLGIAIGLRDQRRLRRMAALAVFELAVHAVVAVMALGWDTGFHMSLLSLVPIVFIGLGNRPAVKWLGVLALAAGYVLLRYASRALPPWYEVPQDLALWLEYFNIVAMVLLLALGAFLHYGAVLTGERMLLDLAGTDPLTGLANRRRWLEQTRLAQRRLAEEHRSFSVLLADIDHFKFVNDRYGHGGGDEVLRAIGGALKGALRGIDTVARWGGEEFAILLAGTREADAARVAEELRQQVAALDLRLRGEPVRLSVTLGAAQAHRGETVEAVLQRAGQALYRGKAAGRNRVELAPPAVTVAAPG